MTNFVLSEFPMTCMTTFVCFDFYDRNFAWDCIILLSCLRISTTYMVIIICQVFWCLSILQEKYPTCLHDVFWSLTATKRSFNKLLFECNEIDTYSNRQKTPGIFLISEYVKVQVYWNTCNTRTREKHVRYEKLTTEKDRSCILRSVGLSRRCRWTCIFFYEVACNYDKNSPKLLFQVGTKCLFVDVIFPF